MTHVSRRNLPIDTEKEINDALIEIFSNLKSKDADKVLSALLTETEEIMLAKRLAAAIMLMNGIPYEKISDSLKLTNQTISYIHAEITDRKETYQFLASKIKPWKRKQLLKSILKGVAFEGAKLLTKHAGGRIY